MIEATQLSGTTITVENAKHSPKLVAWMEAMGDYSNVRMGLAGDNYSYEEVFGHKQPVEKANDQS